MRNENLVERFADFLDDIKLEIQRKTVPVCFHCGELYEKDTNHSGDSYTTWKPRCLCLNKTTIRVMTGAFSEDE